MENNNNIFLGKLQKSGCYLNNGKYGYFITCGKKNYKLPEFLLPEEVTLEMANRIISYKKQISEQWLEKKNSNSKDESDDDESSESSIVKKLTKSV